MNTGFVSPARLLSAAQPALWPLETENNINIVKRIRLQNGVNGFEKPEKKVKTGIKIELQEMHRDLLDIRPFRRSPGSQRQAALFWC